MSNFCSKCGNPVNTDSRFCSKCGGQLIEGQADSRIQQASTKAPPYTRSEQILYSLTGSLQKGIFARKAYGVGFTANHVIFAAITTEMQKEAAAKAKENAKAEGKGFFGKMAAQMTSTRKLMEEIFSKPLNDILAMNPDNFVIENQQVKKMKYKVNTSTDPDVQTTNDDYLIIQTFSDKYKILIKSGANKRKLKNALDGIYGKRLK